MLTLQKRLHISFAVALALILITGISAIFYIHQFDRSVHQTLVKDMELAESIDVLRTSLENYEISYRAYKKNPSDAELDKVLGKLNIFLADLNKSKSISLIKQNILIHDEMIKEAEVVGVMIGKLRVEEVPRAAFIKVGDTFMEKIHLQLDSIQKHRRKEMIGRYSTVDELFARAQQNQILIIIVMLIGGAFLAFFMPRRTVWPFRRVLWAFDEALDCNLNVRLPEQGGDELVDISKSFNRMMAQFEKLDEMKVKRIAFERRRFEVLANSLDMGVILVSVEGKVLFVNTPSYRVFNITSTQVINKDLESSPLPPQIIEFLKKALASKQKVEDIVWEGDFKLSGGKSIKRKVDIDMIPVLTHAGDLVNMIMFIEERDVERDKRIFQSEVYVEKEE